MIYHVYIYPRGETVVYKNASTHVGAFDVLGHLFEVPAQLGQFWFHELLAGTSTSVHQDDGLFPNILNLEAGILQLRQ